MVSRRPNSKDTVSDRNFNIRISLIIKNVAEISYRELPILKNFAGIDFCESAFSGVEKGISYSGQIREIREMFFPGKFFPLR